MKCKILKCEYCNKETSHRTIKRFGRSGGGIRYRLKREVKLCTNCNKRTIKNMKSGKTYISGY